MLQVEERRVLIQQACEGVVSNRPLKLLLHCLLDGGNYLNEGTARAGALGMAPLLASVTGCCNVLHHIPHGVTKHRIHWPACVNGQWEAIARLWC